MGRDLISSERKLQKLLAAAIGALRSDLFSERLMDWIAAEVKCDNIAVIGYFQDRQPQIFGKQSQHPKVHEKLESEYVDSAYLLDPFHELHLQSAAAGVYRLRDIAPDHFQINQYYLNYYEATTLIDEIAVLGYPAPGVSIQICLGRDSTSSKHFEENDLLKAERVAPVAAALVEFNWSDLQTAGVYKTEETILRLLNLVQSNLGTKLTPRQAEVAFYVLKGHSSESTGLNLGISPETVKVFRKQLYKKLGISSQAELFNVLVPMLRL